MAAVTRCLITAYDLDAGKQAWRFTRCPAAVLYTALHQNATAAADLGTPESPRFGRGGNFWGISWPMTVSRAFSMTGTGKSGTLKAVIEAPRRHYDVSIQPNCIE